MRLSEWEKKSLVSQLKYHSCWYNLPSTAITLTSPHQSHISYWKRWTDIQFALHFNNMTFAFLFLLDRIPVTRASPPHRCPFPFFTQIFQAAESSECRPRTPWPRLPHLIQHCPGSKSTLSCPGVHFHCLETRPASSFTGERQLCLRGRGAACINWPFLQVRDKEQQRGTNYHSLYVQTSGKDCC